MKTGPDAVGTAENESGSAIHENGTQSRRYYRKRVQKHKTCKLDPTPSVSPNMSLGAQYMKTGPDTLGTGEMSSGAQNMKTGPDALRSAKNVSGSAKHENDTLSMPKTGPRAQNMKTGHDALYIVENESGSAKHENGTRHPRSRRK
jgi:hypothetical protein